MFLKTTLLTSFILLSCLVFFGQSAFPYEQEWKLIDSLINKKNLPKSALTEVNKVYAAAKKDNQEAQWVKAIIYWNRLQEPEDQDINQSIHKLAAEITTAPPRVAALLKSIEAEELFQYLQGNRYQIQNRTSIIADTATDILTWTTVHFEMMIRSLYLSSLNDASPLQRTPLDAFEPVLINGNVRELRPTLFDLLAWRALDYFRIDFSDDLKARDDGLMENIALFSEAPYFMHFGFSKTDSATNNLIAIRIYQQLLRFHAKDIHLDAWIDADISRIQFAYQYAQLPDKDSLYLNALGRITRQFGTLSVSSKSWWLQAQWWASKASSYDPLRDTSHRFDYLKAIELCKQAIRQPDSSEGKSNCEQLIKNIQEKNFSIYSEKVNIPNQPFRVMLYYKNINRLYARIIRVDEATREFFEDNAYDTDNWSKWSKYPIEKKFVQLLPETNDHQGHRAEIKIEELPAGQYALLTSTDSVFSEKGFLAMNSFFCSSIAFVKNGQDYFVLDRDSGHPLKGVKIKSSLKENKNGRTVYRQGKVYQSDVHGYFHLARQDENAELKLEFYLGKDYLSNSQYIYYNDKNDDDDGDDTDRKSFESDEMHDYLFLDRSIYRPGQTIYFKGLLITKEFKTRKYKIAAEQETKILLKDANNQIIDSLILKSNDFGSFKGSFHLPENLLNGEFSLHDKATLDQQAFSVEEYKRPSFYTKFDPVTGSCQIGDTIKLTVSAVAYAGNPIDGATITWRVYRETRYPYTWLFNKIPFRVREAIAYGASNTDSHGKFMIHFVASPDKNIGKTTKPVFTYRIETTITDAGGESRTATTTVSASHQSFEIVSSLPAQSRIPRDSLYRIPVITKNAAGVFQKENLRFSIYTLNGPQRLIRKRYWEQPDQFVIPEAEFIKNFPNDEYRDESDIKTWKQGSEVFEKVDSTNTDGIMSIDKKTLASLDAGWYLFEFKAVDKDGEEIVDKRYVEIVVNEKRPSVPSYNIIRYQEIASEPGLSVRIQTGSDAKDIFVIRARQVTSDTATKYFFYNLSQGIRDSGMVIKESDRGGFALNDIFVINNRWYSSEHFFIIPWTNKELEISYQSWKDKTQPGNKEQWKVRISGNKKDQLMAEVLTSMYDASLDQFKAHSWSPPGLYPAYRRENAWDDLNNFKDKYSIVRPFGIYKPPYIRLTVYDALIQFGSVNRPVMLQGRVSGISVNTTMQKGGGNELNDVVVLGYSANKKTAVAIPHNRDEDKVTNATDISKSDEETIQIRKNFNETAFFQPDLKTDAQGNVEINFTMSDALTKWKWMVLANTKDLSFGYAEKFVVTQKELMLQTNMPRFFREGDSMLLPVKIANLSSQTMSGTIRLEWLDADNNVNVDTALGNFTSVKPFTVSASQSGIVFFPALVPAHFDRPLLYRITARTNTKGTVYSDGEENIIPVLGNRMLITESLPLNMDGQKEKHFQFVKLIKSKESATLQNQSLTVEYTTNPVWYAVQSLPYLMEFPYECAEQTFNRFYANALASHIVQVSPALQSIFEKWKNTDTAALLSNLQKNEELKSVLVRETPWVLQAQSETEQKKNLALLFDMIRMRAALKSAFDKLQQMQSESGGFAWFKGGLEDRYITQYIISGIGRLLKLKSTPADLQDPLNKMARAAIAFLDKGINSDYERRDKSLRDYNLNPIQIQYLYMRSYFPDLKVPGNIFSALNYYRKLSIEEWTKQCVYMQGMIALFLSRTGDAKTANDILASLKENAINSPELGMYWKSINSGYYWQEAPVETQSLLMETFQELHPDLNTINQMKLWLLQQKRTSHWPTTKATADACYALLLDGSDWISSQQTVNIQLGNYKINTSEEKTEEGTGYYKKQISGDQVVPDMGNIDVILNNVTSTVKGQQSTVNRQPQTSNPSWGAVYWQYFENLDKITTAQTQLSITRNVFIEKNSDKGPVLEAVSEKNILKPGDKLKIHIVIKSDRDLEYVHLKDMRAACLEPVNVLSGYQWQDGLGYYQTTQDVSTSFFFDRLPKGTFVFEYPVFVTTSGNYSNGISVLECMYAPEFAAHSEGIRLYVESK
jgi:uncharacterized protein YfaS (alpha-2-macroglobulin family)